MSLNVQVPIGGGGGQVFNVKAYGAKGDGVTNDTTAVQASIAAANSVSGSVFFPPGVYLCSTLTVSASYVTLLGSRGSSLQLISATDGPLIATPNDGIQRTDLRIIGLSLDGNASNQTGTPALVDIFGMNNLVLDLLTLTNPSGDAVRVGSSGAAVNLNPFFRSLIIRGSITNSQANGIELGSQSSDAHVLDCDIGQFSNGAGVLLSGHYGAEITAVDCWSNKFGYQLYSGNRTRLSNCLADSSGIYGYFVQQSNDLQFSNCQARESSQNSHNTYEGFHFEGSSGAALTSNVSMVGCRAMGTFQSFGVNVLQYVSGFSWSSGSLVGNVTNPATIGATGNVNIKFDHVIGLNPSGSAIPGAAFSIGASTVAATNNTGVDGMLYVTAVGIVTSVSVNGVVVRSTALIIGDSFRVSAGGTIAITYTGAPTVVFVGD